MKRLLVVLGLSFAVPPAGWAVLARAPWRWWKKALLALPVLALAVAHLVAVWGMRFELLGSGSVHPYFPKRESHYAAIEKKAQQDSAQTALVTATPAPEPQPSDRASGVAEAAPPAPKPSVAPENAALTAKGFWPGFNGPDRDAQYRETEILTSWPAKGLRELWRRPVGGGYASMAVAGGRIFTIEQRRDQEAAVAYDLETGRELWAVTWKAFFQETMGGDGPRATPAWDAGTVYFLGAEGEFRATDATSGKTVWRKNILQDNGASNALWGMAAAPLIVDDKVIVLPGGSGGKSVVAYHKATGQRLWSALDDRAAYTAPMLVTLAGERQILVVTVDRAAGLKPETGELLWAFSWKTEYDVNSALPVIVSPERFVLTAGYGHGAAMVEVKKSGDQWTATEIWKSQALKNRFNSNALRNGVVYGVDEGILVAMDAATGQRKWKGGRYGYGQFVMAGGFLVILSETGEVALVKANPDRHEELARFQALDGKTWNPPVIAGGRLIVRNTTEMACYWIAP